jgi:hypothetical protein
MTLGDSGSFSCLDADGSHQTNLTNFKKGNGYQADWWSPDNTTTVPMPTAAVTETSK